MHKKRKSYALDVIGDCWTLLIIHQNKRNPYHVQLAEESHHLPDQHLGLAA